MKVAISGKGGTGKTTLSAMLAGALSLKGQAVVAIDADPDANLASALGLAPGEDITPLAHMRELIQERTGAKGDYGGYFKLNPRVDDIPQAYAKKLGNIRLLVLGGVSRGGEGCICPATALLKALLVHLVLGRDEHLVMDMEAGLEHLGRATAKSVDSLIVVVNPEPWSIQTAHRVRKLAADVGVRNVVAVANCVHGQDEIEAARRQLGDIPLVGALPFDERLSSGVLRIGPDGGILPGEAFTANAQAVEAILSRLQSLAETHLSG